MNWKVLMLLNVLLLSVTVRGQQENIWAFGQYAGLDFNSGTPMPIKTAINRWEGCASVCDKNGQLLFYTEGDTIWNRNHLIMPDGSGRKAFTSMATTIACRGLKRSRRIIARVPPSGG